MSNPIRTCIACRKEFEKKQLLRIVKKSDGSFLLDKTGKSDGRGAYICYSAECAQKLKKAKLLNRAFKQEVSEEIYTKVEDAILGKEE